MTQVSGSVTVELDLDRLAEEIAVRVAGALHEMGHPRNGGDDTYDRDSDPDPGAGSRRYGPPRSGGVTSSGVEYDREVTE